MYFESAKANAWACFLDFLGVFKIEEMQYQRERERLKTVKTDKGSRGPIFLFFYFFLYNNNLGFSFCDGYFISLNNSEGV